MIEEFANDKTRFSLGYIFEFLDPIPSKLWTNQQLNLQKNIQPTNNPNDSIDYDPNHLSFSKELDTLSLKNRSKTKYHLLKERLSIQDMKHVISNRLKSLDEPLQSIFFKNTTKLEKFFYPFTLCNIFLIGFIMGKFPQWFHIYYTVLFLFLMPIRFYTYYKKNNHYFMADLCYFVNVLCLIYIWIRPNSQNLFQSCFALTFGSLSFAVITWRNSLVLHSLDKTTSCFIHIVPPLTIYVIYYGLPEQYKLERFPGAIHTTLNLKENILWTSFYYLLWQVSYHYFITLKKSQKIKSGQRMTSFEYLTTHQFKNFWAVNLKSPWPMVIYTVAQYFYQLCTMLLCSIWLRYRWAASIFLCCISLTAAYNGATYYVDVYGRNFEAQINKLKQELELLQKKVNDHNINNNSSSSSSINIIPSEESISQIFTNEGLSSD